MADSEDVPNEGSPAVKMKIFMSISVHVSSHILRRRGLYGNRTNDSPLMLFVQRCKILITDLSEREGERRAGAERGIKDASSCMASSLPLCSGQNLLLSGFHFSYPFPFK